MTQIPFEAKLEQNGLPALCSSISDGNACDGRGPQKRLGNYLVVMP